MHRSIKNLHISSIIYSIQEVKAAQYLWMAINIPTDRYSACEWTSKIWFVHTVEYYLSIKRKEAHDTAWMNLENKYAKRKKPVIKSHMLCDSIDLKYLEQWNLWRQNRRLVVAKGEAVGSDCLFWGQWQYSEIRQQCVFTKHCIEHFKGMNFTVHELYLNKTVIF